MTRREDLTGKKFGRLDRGWPPEKAVKTPMKRGGCNE